MNVRGMSIVGLTTLAVCAGLVGAPADAQRRPGAERVVPDLSPEGTVSQVIGVNCKISVWYHRPGVKSRTVWGGQLVPDGRVWRAGANENTTITFEEDVKVEGQDLPAGKYGFFVLLSGDEVTLIFSKDSESWGSFSYKEANDALRVTVGLESADHMERLAIGFEDLEDYSCSAYLHWESKKVKFKIEAVNKAS